MSGHEIHTEELFGALLGGLIAALVGAGVFSVVTSGSGDQSLFLSAVLVGFGLVTALMLGGVHASGRMPWLATALLFAAGFTSLWSVALSRVVQERGMVLLVIGTTVAAGLGAGRRFGTGADAEAQAGDEAAWTP